MSDLQFNLKGTLGWKNVLFALPLAALWAIPIARAIGFIKYAAGVYTAEQTINARNDLSHGIALLIAYALCLQIDVGLCVLFARKSTIALLLLLFIPFWVVVEIIRFRPEEVIVLVPTMSPLWPIKWNLLAFAAAAVGVIGLKKLKKSKLGNS